MTMNMPKGQRVKLTGYAFANGVHERTEASKAMRGAAMYFVACLDREEIDEIMGVPKVDILKELSEARGGAVIYNEATGVRLGSLYDLAATEIEKLRAVIEEVGSGDWTDAAYALELPSCLAESGWFKRARAAVTS